MQPTAPAAVDEERQRRKTELRASVLARRDAIPAELRAADSLRIAGRIMALPSWQRASIVLLTLPFRSEWDTVPLVEAARAAGKAVVLPRVDMAARHLVLYRCDEPRSDVAPGYRGIPEPRERLPRIDAAEVDWILVPGVAFDADGGRLGHGAGYYDRLLATVAPTVPKVAGAFDVQIVDEVPRLRHDIGVDLVVTPTRRFGAA